MKTEKEIKTKVINEVIEMVHEEIRSAQQGMNIYLPLNHLLIKFQSLLPKEEPEKGKPLTENKTKGNLKPETPNERQCPPPPIRVLIEGEEPERQIKEDVKPEPTQEIKIEEKSISDFISEIKIDKSNFEHIAKTGKINGSLFLEIQDKMRAFACQEVTSVLFMDSEQEEAISKITHDAVTKLKKELLTKVQPTKTQEEMDREWKRESLIAHPMNDDSLDDLLQKAINYGRNTKQN